MYNLLNMCIIYTSLFFFLIYADWRLYQKSGAWLGPLIGFIGNSIVSAYAGKIDVLGLSDEDVKLL